MSQLPSAPGAAEDPVASAFQAVGRAMIAVTTRSLAGLDSDVTLPQYRALVSLVSLGPQRTSDLAQELGVAASTATRLADRLVSKGLVTRSRHKGDLRVTWLTLTGAGKALLGEAMRLRRAEISSLARAASAATGHEDELAAALNAFAEAAREPVDAEWWSRWGQCDHTVDGAVVTDRNTRSKSRSS
ncbi:MarR family winged helix-turn-helix transcriptional regulator [Saccharopolyspora erythraea]|uniref:MarR family winged helix-turn-helix transcriptional regulator n=1 Tax=Saccharopolyspora erythraea TaxID=1836 RepID=UPI0020119E49|nr:MarR family transcriptional regulator [Saccharopolyspora erythraea]